MSADLIRDLGGDKPPILVCRSYLRRQIAAARLSGDQGDRAGRTETGRGDKIPK